MVTTKLDIACGKRKQEGFTGLDIREDVNADIIHDIRKYPWPFEDESIEEVYCCHFIEHLAGEERIPFFNELYRIMKKGAKATIVAPHWSHARAYGDPTHKFPPISEWTYYYVQKPWREQEGSHVGYTCDFEISMVGMHDPNDQWVAFRNYETKASMMQRNINTCGDIIATLTKK